MEMSVQVCGATVKALRQVRQQAFREGDLRVIRRVTTLLEVGQRQPVAQVAENVGVSVSTVDNWLHSFVLRRLASLRYRRSPGRPSKLTPTQKARLVTLLTEGPQAVGYPTGCWSSALVQDLIYREFGVLYTVHYVAVLLANLGYSYQKARFVSDHLDPERRRQWREEEWPAIVRQARARGALLLFGDEASFAQWGSLGYTWSKRGEQPLVQTCGKRKAYKVFGLIDSVTGRFFQRGQTERFTAATYCSFLEQVLTTTTQPLIVLHDGARYHTAVATREFIAQHAERLSVYQLPSYSPDYNPIEHLWKTMKGRTTHNRYFPTFEALVAAVEAGLTHFAHAPADVLRVMGSYLDELIEAAVAA